MGMIIIDDSLEDRIADVSLWPRPVLLFLLPCLILLRLLPTPVKFIDFFEGLGPNIELKLLRLLSEPCDAS